MAGPSLALLVATAGGAGYAPAAPGTAGAAVGVGLFLLLSSLSPALYALTTAALFALGVWASDAAEVAFGREDDGRIVIDEVVGQLVALGPLVGLSGVLGAGRLSAWLVTGFVAFRLFDIWKPGPVRLAERRVPGGAGVMLDDAVAGVLAAVVMALLLWWRAPGAGAV